jgi:hypothetical protein
MKSKIKGDTRTAPQLPEIPYLAKMDGTGNNAEEVVIVIVDPTPGRNNESITFLRPYDNGSCDFQVGEVVVDLSDFVPLNPSVSITLSN